MQPAPHFVLTKGLAAALLTTTAAVPMAGSGLAALSPHLPAAFEMLDLWAAERTAAAAAAAAAAGPGSGDGISAAAGSTIRDLVAGGGGDETAAGGGCVRRLLAHGGKGGPAGPAAVCAAWLVDRKGCTVKQALGLLSANRLADAPTAGPPALAPRASRARARFPLLTACRLLPVCRAARGGGEAGRAPDPAAGDRAAECPKAPRRVRHAAAAAFDLPVGLLWARAGGVGGGMGRRTWRRRGVSGGGLQCARGPFPVGQTAGPQADCTYQPG